MTSWGLQTSVSTLDQPPSWGSSAQTPASSSGWRGVGWSQWTSGGRRPCWPCGRTGPSAGTAAPAPAESRNPSWWRPSSSARRQCEPHAFIVLFKLSLFKIFRKMTDADVSLYWPSLLVALWVLAVTVISIRVIIHSEGGQGLLASAHGSEAGAGAPGGLIWVEIGAHFDDFWASRWKIQKQVLGVKFVPSYFLKPKALSENDNLNFDFNCNVVKMCIYGKVV